MQNRPLNKDSGKEIDRAGNGGCAGRRDTSKRDKLRNRAGKGGRQKGRERTPAQGSPSLHFSELPRGSGGKLKMKHLVPGSRDVTLRVRGLGRLPRGNGEGARTGGAECKLPLPPTQARRKLADQHTRAVECQCPLVAQGRLENCWRVGGGGGVRTEDFGPLESADARENLCTSTLC